MNAEAFKDAKAEIEALDSNIRSGAHRMMFERLCLGFIWGSGASFLWPKSVIYMSGAALAFGLWRVVRRWQARQIIRDKKADAWFKRRSAAGIDHGSRVGREEG